jgi:outer membrane putative beta-barrel porin/alpha-amylase
VSIRSIVLAVLLSFAVLPAYAEESKKIEELGTDEKLQRLYELYRVGETVSLKPHESLLGLSVAYAFSDKNELGTHTSNSSLSLQGSFAYGITDRLEASVIVPLQWNQNRLETSDTTLVNTSVAGLGDVGVQLLATLPVKAFEMTGVLGITFPTGREGLGQTGIRSLIGLNVATILRPAFLFGSLAWQRDWERDVNGITYTGGIGFYLNYSLSAGLQISGTRFLNPPRGRIHDTASATVQVSYQMTPTFGISPYMSFGLTDSAPNVAIGFNLSQRF